VRWLLACAVVVLSWSAPLRAQAPAAPDGKDAEARIQVGRAIARWSRDGAALESALVALGTAAMPCVCDLLEAQPRSVPVEPLARALGRVPHHRAPAALGRLLRSTSVAERTAAVAALAALDRRDAYVELAVALDDADAAVAELAEQHLAGTARDPSALAAGLAARVGEAQDRGRVARVLGRRGDEPSHRALAGLTSDPDPRTQLAALDGLWLTARPADGELVSELLSPQRSPAVRGRACLVLGKLRHRESAPTLIAALRDGERALAANALWALREISGLRLKADHELWQQWWQRQRRGEPRRFETTDGQR
jgi:HEAT repeat protein